MPFASPTGPVPAPAAPGVQGLQAFAAANANPIPRSAESEARGAAMYELYCLVCHGAEGMGGNTGPVTQTGVYPPIVPPVAAGNATGLADGYIYAIIRHGRGLMPSYAVQVPHDDRWHVVNYIRRLQEGGGPVAAAAESEQGAAGAPEAGAGGAGVAGSAGGPEGGE